jgi:hypothetical protein
LAWVLLQLRRFPEAESEFEALRKLPHRMKPDELEGMAQALIGAGKPGDAAKLVASHGGESQPMATLYARVAAAAGADAPSPPDHFIQKGGPGRAWYEAWMGPPGGFEKLPPLEGAGKQQGYSIVAAARRSPEAAVAQAERASEDALDTVGQPLGVLLAAQALKHGGRARAEKILDALSPPSGVREAVLTGKDSPELSDESLDVQAAVELARAWRIGGAEGRKLADRAKSDDLLHDAVALASAWK